MPDPYDWPHLLSLAVHEFRTPASIIAGYLRMLERDANPPLADRHRKLVSEAARSCARLVEIIAELSDVSKLESGALPLARRPFDLFACVSDAAGGVVEGRDRGVGIEVRGAAAGAPVAGDEARLSAAIGAILRAVAREQPGPCTVAVERRLAPLGNGTTSAVIVIAADAAVQSAHEAPAGAFDEFRGGLGLALPIARRVIELHGGRVWSPAGSGPRGAVLMSVPLSE